MTDDERYAQSASQVRPLTHNERITLFLLPKDPNDPDWDARLARAIDFLDRNGH